MRKFPIRKTKTRWASRDQHLHWIAAGDQFPDWVYGNSVTVWMLEHLWPEKTLHRLICWRYGHDVTQQPVGWVCCIWCSRPK